MSYKFLPLQNLMDLQQVLLLIGAKLLATKQHSEFYGNLNNIFSCLLRFLFVLCLKDEINFIGSDALRLTKYELTKT